MILIQVKLKIQALNKMIECICRLQILCNFCCSNVLINFRELSLYPDLYYTTLRTLDWMYCTMLRTPGWMYYTMLRTLDWMYYTTLRTLDWMYYTTLRTLDWMYSNDPGHLNGQTLPTPGRNEWTTIQPSAPPSFGPWLWIKVTIFVSDIKRK